MKRIDIIYENLKAICYQDGINANDLAGVLGLTRANVSSDLNKLCVEGKVKKSNSRPVLFTVNYEKVQCKNECVFDRYLRENNSLSVAVEYAKAAILYPPKGMHTLILGETGVGKSMFAELMYRYALEAGKIKKDSPFIIFNCADYSNNPQLLLSQLFGVKKGAYTGADSDRQGLIEKSQGGILFLDEVHRLPSEGQEMLFTVMDKGIFRRLGESEKERTSEVMFISATTENPDSSLLTTFTRRIPMIIKIPSLKERGFQERFKLIRTFFTEESHRLSRDISVSINSLRALFSYDCKNNVGQLKTDIQLSCAKAYADFLSNKKQVVKINSSDLPVYVREGLYKEKEHRQIWNSIIGIHNRYYVFNNECNEDIFDFEKKQQSIYEIIDEKANELRAKGISDICLEKIMEEDIDRYFAQYIGRVNNNINVSNIKNLVDPFIVHVVEEILKYSELKLNKSFSQKVYFGLSFHIKTLVDRIKNNKTIINPQIKKIKNEYKNEFNVALDCLKIIESNLDIKLPVDEAGFIAMFFVLDHKNIQNTINNPGVLVIAHGNSTATSMVQTANTLLGIEYAVAFDAPLDVSANEILNEVREYVTKDTRKAGYIFLTDMGSLTTFGQIIEKEFEIPVKVISLVSTLHVIEATRKSSLGYKLDDIYRDCYDIMPFVENETIEKTKCKTMAIVTICMTGEGSAIAIKNLLLDNLKIDDKLCEIIPLNLIHKEKIESRIITLGKEKEIIAIVSHFNINTEIPQFSLEQVIGLNAISDIQKIVDIQSTYYGMGKTLKNHLKNVEGEKVFQDVEQFISKIQKSIKEKIAVEDLIGITLHISCMIDRLKSGEKFIEYGDKNKYIHNNKGLYYIVKNSLFFIEEKYKINIMDDEVCYIMNIIEKRKMQFEKLEE
ncbi:sigma 54-interacting transcriptional regulator [Clostridium sp. FP1]|uniref:sigma 54-interacting transcriptional regulator n=1 Tax=Clostridium sp. FP1 TaxID=2724076 RepID=UPI0013E8F818|nr:sigma-54-dependent transcriptional regulator [Clostridium sp. FP1]MBZ9633807.1 sigma 54-interacting transcriptional regulator [Clostridium sp. FP1]